MKRILVVAARVVLAAVFLWAAIVKLREPYLLFAMSIDSMQILPELGVLIVARTLPWLELALGILLLTGWKIRYAASCATALLAAFLGVMILSYARGLAVDCGCFGPGEKLGPLTLARDSLLLALSMWVTCETFRGGTAARVSGSPRF